MHRVVADRPRHRVHAGSANCPTQTVVARLSTAPNIHERRLPGGARVSERWTGPERLTVRVTGEVDAFDQYAITDLLTNAILRGGRHLRIDATSITFCDVAVLRTLVRSQRFLARTGGTLTVSGLRSPFEPVWTLAQAEESSRFAGQFADTMTRLPAARVLTGARCA